MNYRLIASLGVASAAIVGPSIRHFFGKINMIGPLILSLATPCVAGIYEKLENLLEEAIYRGYVYGKI